MSDSDHPVDAVRLEQYEIVWVLPAQYALKDRPDGFGLEIVDFLGPGGLDHRGKGTVWVRGPVIHAASTAHGVRLVRGEPLESYSGAAIAVALLLAALALAMVANIVLIR